MRVVAHRGKEDYWLWDHSMRISWLWNHSMRISWLWDHLMRPTLRARGEIELPSTPGKRSVESCSLLDDREQPVSDRGHRSNIPAQLTLPNPKQCGGRRQGNNGLSLHAAEGSVGRSVARCLHSATRGYYACELTLNPNTANRRLSLSEDNRKVTRVGEDQSYPNHPERFDSQYQVLGREALTGRCYWEVEWEGVVNIGVTYRGITRRGWGRDSRLGGNNKSWSLLCQVGRYSARYNSSGTVERLPPAGSHRVGVYLDRPAGTLSFYRVSPGGGGSSDTLTHLLTFQSTFTQEDLLPEFELWGRGASVSLCRL
ncbi:unnamed protein product [Arctogadus glacialis]